MTDDNLTIGELGGYTNNSMNREGLKKLVEKVNAGGGVEYTAGTGISISDENVISLLANGGWTHYDDKSQVYTDYINNHDLEFCVMVKRDNKYYLGVFNGDNRELHSSNRYINTVAFYNSEGNEKLSIIHFDMYSSTPTSITIAQTPHKIPASFPDIKSFYKMIDLITGNDVSSNDIGDYINGTSGICLKSFCFVPINSDRTYSFVPKGIKYASVQINTVGFMEIDLLAYYNSVVNNTTYSVSYTSLGVSNTYSVIENLTQNDKIQFFKRNRTTPKHVTPTP